MILIEHILFGSGGEEKYVELYCAEWDLLSVANGIQILNVSVNIFLVYVLVGGIGFYGYGIEQDDIFIWARWLLYHNPLVDWRNSDYLPCPTRKPGYSGQDTRKIRQTIPNCDILIRLAQGQFSGSIEWETFRPQAGPCAWGCFFTRPDG